LLIEERLRPGKKAQYQRIVAVEFTNQGKRWQAVYYAPAGESGAYYRPDGRAMRHLSLASPLEYSRISSPFTLQRLHPILKVNRPHFGVDYAAPHGTPVRSAADGVVEWVGAKGACGKMIIVRHDDVYATHYLHLGRFAAGIREGQRVSQGQLLGYVGSTGLSTGPHLDFRLTQGDTYLDPQKHHSILAAGVPKTELPAYRTYAQRLLQRFKDPEVIVAQWSATVP
jgi:murein DD-endopeptidase MepM/ murein hydrolase activator NlpD